MRPRAKTVPWVRQGDDLAVALNPVPADLRRLPDPDGAIEWVLSHADGSRTEADLRAAGEVGAPAFASALATLDEAGLLVDADDLAGLSHPELERWRNNLGFFDAYADLVHGPARYHERLRASRVLLLGAGGLGSMTLMNLVGLGIGEIVVVDFDRVEAANFSRQFAFRADDVGMLKAPKAGEWARNFSRHTVVTALTSRIGSVDDVAALLDGIDLVVSAIDQPSEAPLWVNEACHRAGVPSLYGGFFFTKGRYESVWPGHSACLACLVIGEAFELQPINRATGPSVSIVGGLMALEAVRYLTGFAPPAAAAQSWIVDFTTGAVSPSVRWGRSPDCPVCATPPTGADADPAPPLRDHGARPPGTPAAGGADGLRRTAQPSLSSRVDVRHLAVQPDGADFLIGDLARGIFVAVPEVGAVAVNSLQRGATIAEATADASAFAGTDVNVLEFVGVLRQRGLIRESALAVESEHEPEMGRQDDMEGQVVTRSWASRIADPLASVLLSPPALVCYLFAFVSGLAIMLFEAALRPSWESIVFLPDPALALLINILTVLTLAGIHEGFHWLAARRLGLPAQLRVSRRGLFVVLETDLTRLWGVPRRRRYVAFLAGSAFDGAVLGICLILRLAHQQGWITVPETLNRYLAIVVLSAVVALIGQTPLFMRTDLYAVLVTALSCHNLYRTSMLTVKGRLVGLTPAEQAEMSGSSERDRQVGRWFSGLYLVGLLGLTYLIFGLFIPAAFSLVVWSVQNVMSSGITTLVFWEALIVAIFLTAEVVWPPAHWLAGRLRQGRASAHPLSAVGA